MIKNKLIINHRYYMLHFLDNQIFITDIQKLRMHNIVVFNLRFSAHNTSLQNKFSCLIFRQIYRINYPGVNVKKKRIYSPIRPTSIKLEFIVIILAILPA